MKRYLLFTTCTGHQDDDDIITNSGACFIDSFDTVEECLREAREDLTAEAESVANRACDDTDEEFESYMQAYLANTVVYDLTEANFPMVGACRNVVESEYHSDTWCDNRVYTVVRIA